MWLEGNDAPSNAARMSKAEQLTGAPSTHVWVPENDGKPYKCTRPISMLHTLIISLRHACD